MRGRSPISHNTSVRDLPGVNARRAQQHTHPPLLPSCRAAASMPCRPSFATRAAHAAHAAGVPRPCALCRLSPAARRVPRRARCCAAPSSPAARRSEVPRPCRPCRRVPPPRAPVAYCPAAPRVLSVPTPPCFPVTASPPAARYLVTRRATRRRATRYLTVWP